MCLLTHGTHLEPDLFYWNKIDYLVIGDYFSKYLIIRRLPNSSTHAVIKELGLIFTELGRPFVLRSDNGTVLQFEGISQLPEFPSGGPRHQQPTLSTKQWFRRGFGGYRQEADGQIFKRGETVELWSSTVPDHSNLIYSPVSIRRC